jgi:hypothetical protein
METHAPVVIWSRGDYRIVAREDEYKDELVPQLVVECRDTDALGAECWTVLFANEGGIDNGLDTLAFEIASRIEVMPVWVRAFVCEQLEHINAVEERDGGAA